MKISPDILAQIRKGVNIVDVVGEHVVLRKSGSNHSGLCPFHSERSPSFSVSEQKQLYHCYGCKKGGDLFSFVQEIAGISFPEAVEELAARARVALPKEWHAQSGAPRDGQLEKLELAYKVNRFAAAFYSSALGGQPHIHRYFAERGVGPDAIREFYAGAAPASWDALATHLVNKQAPVQVAVDLGLVRPSQKDVRSGPGYFDLFRNRAMFPILDSRGRVAGFGGRALPLPPGAPDVGGESPKYLNSPESQVFQKSKLVYGLFQAQKHIREKDEVVLVEGYFDVIGLHIAGFKNVVATCGTSLTIEHLKIFKRLASKVTILFDGDRAGISATERAMELGLSEGQALYGAAMPKGMDPDELLLQGPGGKEQMTAILEAARPLIDTRIDEVCTQASQGGAEDRARAIKQLGVWLGQFKDPVGREVRADAVCKRLEITRDLLERAGGPAAPIARSGSRAPQKGGGTVPRPHMPQPRGPTRPGRPAPKAVSALTPTDRILLSAWIRGGEETQALHRAMRELPENVSAAELFDYLPVRDWVAALIGEPGGMERFRVAPETYLEQVNDPQVRSFITEALIGGGEETTAEGSSNRLFEIREAAAHSVHRSWARFSQALLRALSEAEANKDAGLHAQLMKQYLDVQRRIKEFNNFYDEA